MSTRRARPVPLEPRVLEEVSRIFGVLGEPGRLRILQLLGDGPLSVSEIVASLGAKQANVSKQLGLLRHAGLLGRERDGALVRYHIAEPMIFELCDLVCAKLRRDAEGRIAALPLGASRRR